MGRHIEAGSSPLSRGIQLGRRIGCQPVRIIPALAGNTLVTVGTEGRSIRIIPALAGNTNTYSIPKPNTQDHPRSRGEYGHLFDEFGAVPGSSPLSRGILHGKPPECDGERIIPALAGNTAVGSRGPSVLGDHPRSRGEYRVVSLNIEVLNGSSPLSRGIRLRTPAPRTPSRIIPALAGNTWQVS